MTRFHMLMSSEPLPNKRQALSTVHPSEHILLDAVERDVTRDEEGGNRNKKKNEYVF